VPLFKRNRQLDYLQLTSNLFLHGPSRTCARVFVAKLPHDRVLVIYGFGHLGWLRQNAQQDATVRLRTLDEFVR